MNNKGFEISSEILVEDDFESGLNLALNDFEAKNIFTEIGSNPLEISAYYKKDNIFYAIKTLD